MGIKKTLFLVLFFSSLIPLIAQTNPKKDVLVLHSYHQGLQWTNDITRGITSVLDSEDIEIHIEYLDTKRISSEQYFQERIEFEKAKSTLLSIEYDLIICSDNNALRFITEYQEDFYPELPVIFCGVNNFHLEMLEGRDRITGITEKPDFGATLELIKTVHPERNQVTIILDNTVTGIAIKKEIEPVLARYGDSFTFNFYNHFLLDEVAKDLAYLDENDVILLLTFNSDRQGQFISYEKGIRTITSAAAVPVYGVWDFYFGYGLMGGVMISGYSQGHMAAEMALDYLEGKPLEEIPIEYYSPNIMQFDYRQMERFDLKRDKIPREARVMFLPERNDRKLLLYSFILIGYLFISLLIILIRYFTQKKKNRQLKNDLGSLMEVIPICSHCKSIRDDKGSWDKVEQYISRLSGFELSHGLCPKCLEELYPEEAEALEKEKKNPPENTPSK